MDHGGQVIENSSFSLRQTVLTLVGAFVAFGILTASYATAELPTESALAVEAVVTD